MKPNTRVRVKTSGRMAIVIDIRPYEMTTRAYIRYCSAPFEEDIQPCSNLTEYDPSANSIC